MKPSDKQVRYILYLLSQNGYSTNWMNAQFKDLGATMKERTGKVEDWVRGLDQGRITMVIGRFKRSTPESDSTEFGGWTCGQPKMT
jgi:hypothetical protein